MDFTLFGPMNEMLIAAKCPWWGLVTSLCNWLMMLVYTGGKTEIYILPTHNNDDALQAKSGIVKVLSPC